MLSSFYSFGLSVSFALTQDKSHNNLVEHLLIIPAYLRTNYCHISRDDGQAFIVRVTDVSQATVTLDANHPLAGEDLTFDIKLIEII